MEIKNILLTECPRDAIQGWKTPISTQQKLDYMNLLMRVGFDILDCGSFVNPRMIPQMADTKQLLPQINKDNSKTKLSVIAANYRGAQLACEHENVDYIGYPFSLSETFQQRNTNKSQEEAFVDIEKIMEFLAKNNKELILYFSMAFGNPYNEILYLDDIDKWAERFSNIGVKSIILSDTTGLSTNESINEMFELLIKKYPQIDFGAHFHNLYNESYQKLKSAYDSGCRRFDSSIKGIGGCPFAKNELVGNMPTEQLINFLHKEKIQHSLQLLHFESAYNEAKNIFRF